MTNNFRRCLYVLTLLAGCSNLDRLAEIGEPPALARLRLPEQQVGYQEVKPTEAQPDPHVLTAAEGRKRHQRESNSLWRPGGRSFFRDQRARQVGDILNIVIEVADNAKLENTTSRTRGTNRESMSMPSALGLGPIINKVLPGDPNNMLDITSNSQSSGSGTIDRKEEIKTEIAAMITQILPNGNLVVQGRQEIRVNYELREVAVSGIIKPEDIRSDNTVYSDHIAEARISYGGKGQISAVQQPRWGQQIVDVIAPF